MPTQVRFRRGTTTQNNNFTGASGEITINTSNTTIRVHDGVTPGGKELATVTHVSNEISNVIGAAPAVLDTLNEIAAAINDDPSFFNNTASTASVTAAFNQANAAYNKANVVNESLTTANVVELNNLYFTNDRANTSIDNKVTKSFVEGLAIDVPTSDLTGNILATQLEPTGVVANTYGGASKVPVIVIDNQGRITSAANVNVAGVTNFAASGNTFTISTADGGSFSANIQENSIRLGSDTTGAYVANLVAGTGVTVTGLGDEGTTPTIAIGQDVGQDAFVTFKELTITGNLVVQGNTTTLSTADLVVDDPLIYLGANNIIDDNVDLGFVVHYTDSESQGRHAGLFRDATDKKFKFFANAYHEFSTTIDTSNTAFRYAVVKAEEYEANSITTARSNVGTVLSGTWNGSSISTTYTDAKLTSVSATAPIATDASTGAITLSHASSGVAADTYGGASVIPVYTVNATGHITSASNVTVQVANSNITGNIIASQIQPTGVTPGTYGTATQVSNITVDRQGRITSAANTTIALTATSSINATALGSGTANSSTYLRGDRTWATISAGASLSNDTSTNSNGYYPAMATSTSGSWTTAYVSSTKLYYNPSTGTLNATVFNSLSDAREKENIATITNALQKVSQIRGASFTLKDSQQKSIGVIAQEIEAVVPEVVATNGEGMKSVSYGNLVGLLIEAIKEQQDQINILKHEINSLK